MGGPTYPARMTTNWSLTFDCENPLAQAHLDHVVMTVPEGNELCVV